MNFAIDPSFGTNGQVRVPEDRYSTGRIVVEADGRILVRWGVLNPGDAISIASRRFAAPDRRAMLAP